MNYSVKDNIKRLLKLDLQQKNKFKFFLFPSSEAFSKINPVKSAANASFALAGNYITMLYISDIEFSGSSTINYELAGSTFYTKGLTHPEEITINFIEDEKGTVWRYIHTWRKSILFVEPINEAATSVANAAINTDVNYVFADNQKESERIGMLLYGDSTGKNFSKFPRIMFYGLKFKNMGSLQASNTEGGNLKIPVTFAVREIAAPFV